MQRLFERSDTGSFDTILLKWIFIGNELMRCARFQGLGAGDYFSGVI